MKHWPSNTWQLGRSLRHLIAFGALRGGFKKKSSQTRRAFFFFKKRKKKSISNKSDLLLEDGRHEVYTVFGQQWHLFAGQTELCVSSFFSSLAHAISSSS